MLPKTHGHPTGGRAGGLCGALYSQLVWAFGPGRACNISIKVGIDWLVTTQTTCLKWMLLQHWDPASLVASLIMRIMHESRVLNFNCLNKLQDQRQQQQRQRQQRQVVSMWPTNTLEEVFYLHLTALGRIILHSFSGRSGSKISLRSLAIHALALSVNSIRSPALNHFDSL